jgi:hypothetical protein
MHVCDMTPEQKDEMLEARRRTVRFWLWGKDVHVTLFVYSYEYIQVWIMCSSYSYRLLPATPEKRYSRAPFILEAHSHRESHEWMDIIPVVSEVKILIDGVLNREGSRNEMPDQCIMAEA